MKLVLCGFKGKEVNFLNNNQQANAEAIPIHCYYSIFLPTSVDKVTDKNGLTVV
jgi:hypothetical protein